MFKFSPLARRARTASALWLATLLSVGIWSPSQAAPNPNPPVRGEVGRNRRGPNRGDVLRGTVDRVFSARSFDLRSDDGRIYRVNLRFSVGLEARSNVRVVGDLNGSTFDARVLTIGDFGNDRYDDYNNGGYDNGGYDNGNTNGQYQGQNVVLRGSIVRILNRNEVEVRDEDDGRIYRVRTDRALDYSLRQGDRIEARGELNGNVIRADSTTEIGGNTDNEDGYGNDRNDAVYVNFSGPLLSIDSNREEARVRADNGYTYTLRARRSVLDNFRVGQRVRVQGNWANERVEVTQLTRE